MNQPSPNVNKKRRPRIHHDPSLAKIWPMEMIAEAIPTLRAIDQFRFLTSSQVAKLLFWNQPARHGHPRTLRNAQRAANDTCLVRLKDRQLIERVPVWRYSPKTGNIVLDAANILTKAGVEMVVASYEAEGVEYTPRTKPSDKSLSNKMIDHELAVNEVGIHFMAACRMHGWQALLWHDERDLSQLNKQKLVSFDTFEPDAFFLIQAQGKLHPFFVEIDLGNQTIHSGTGANRDWKAKIGRYVDYFAHRYRQDSFYHGLELVPVVLTLTTKDDRREQLLRATANANGGGRYWYALLSDIDEPGLLHEVWEVVVPVDETTYDTETRSLLTKLQTD